MTRRQRSTNQLAEQAALRLRELFGAGAAPAPLQETHRGALTRRGPATGPAFQSHLYFELDGDVSGEYQAALAVEFARRLERARVTAGSAFCMLGEADPLPSLQWSIDQPALARIDIRTTGGARLWAVERLVRACFEEAVEQCAITTPAPMAARGSRRR